MCCSFSIARELLRPCGDSSGSPLRSASIRRHQARPQAWPFRGGPCRQCCPVEVERTALTADLGTTFPRRVTPGRETAPGGGAGLLALPEARPVSVRIG